MNCQLISIIVAFMILTVYLVDGEESDTLTTSATTPSILPIPGPLERWLKQKKCRILQGTFFEGLMHYLAIDDACKSLKMAVTSKAKEE
ncbi:unnamed protein product [Hydatigera taeniaeformis]|uniref:Secreted protein n=1 Tax=Hydatigena taeniaeformis TaxID=6205 RepID=A0A0R3WWQ2_HYDTA|nr:unnamed protein product [Hydatigera taeniaeformis]